MLIDGFLSLTNHIHHDNQTGQNMAGVQIHGKELLKVNVQGQPRNLVVLRGGESTRLFDAHPLVEGFNAEHRTGLSVVSHKVADAALNDRKTWRSLRAFPVDASIAYEKPGTELGNEIVSSIGGAPRVVLATGRFKGERDVALVALGLSAKDFKKDGNSVVLDISEDRLILVPNFPGPDGWYLPHEPTGVPHGVEESASPDARCLYRSSNSPYVGVLVRGANGFYDRDYVYALYWASGRFGVVAEVPEADVAKIMALLKP